MNWLQHSTRFLKWVEDFFIKDENYSRDLQFFRAGFNPLLKISRDDAAWTQMEQIHFLSTEIQILKLVRGTLLIVPLGDEFLLT